MRTLEARLEKHIDLLMQRYPILETVKQEIIDAYLVMEECYEQDGKLLIAGKLQITAGCGCREGGSASREEGRVENKTSACEFLAVGEDEKHRDGRVCQGWQHR